MLRWAFSSLLSLLLPVRAFRGLVNLLLVGDLSVCWFAGFFFVQGEVKRLQLHSFK